MLFSKRNRFLISGKNLCFERVGFLFFLEMVGATSVNLGRDHHRNFARALRRNIPAGARGRVLFFGDESLGSVKVGKIFSNTTGTFPFLPIPSCPSVVGCASCYLSAQGK